MEKTILTTEIYAMFLQLIVISATVFETKLRTKKSNAFFILAVSVFISITFDAISYLVMDKNLNDSMLFLINLFNYAMPFVVYGMYLEYMNISLREKIPFKTGYLHGGRVAFILGIICTVVFAFEGKFFYISEGVYHRGEWYDGYLAMFVIAMLYVYIVIFMHAGKISLHDTFAYVMFILIPTALIIVNMFIDQLALTIASMALADLIIYIMLQSERESILIKKEEITYKLAHYDELTRLKNRLAFNTTIESMNGDGVVGIAFGDVNGLKYTNDHYGHVAGDKLLCDFADMLTVCYGHENVYRISGDEYVVIVQGISDEQFRQKKEVILERRKEHEFPIASIGFVHGSVSEIRRLLDMAEKEMYADKKAFYAEYPKYGREKTKKPDALTD